MTLFLHSMQLIFCHEKEELLMAAGTHQEHFDLYLYTCFLQLHTAALHVLLKKSQIHERDFAQIFSILSLAFHL